MEQVKEREIMNRTEIPRPQEYRTQFPLTPEAEQAITGYREQLSTLMNQTHPERMIAVVGFCSLDELQVDGQEAALLYGHHLANFLRHNREVTDNLMVILRCPPSKPRSNYGWRGLEHSNPTKAFQLMTNLANMGLPLAIECMSTRHAQYYGDMLTMGWMGARDIESTELRYAIAADVEFPIFLKNGTTGSITSALHARDLIMNPEHKKTAYEMGSLHANFRTGQVERLTNLPGVKDVGIIMRGGERINDPISYEKALREYCEHSESDGFSLLADASHGGSEAHVGKKSVQGQKDCLQTFLRLKEQGVPGLDGFMIESNLYEGMRKGVGGYSQTDPGLNLNDTCDFLRHFARLQAQQKRTYIV